MDKVWVVYEGFVTGKYGDEHNSDPYESEEWLEAICATKELAVAWIMRQTGIAPDEDGESKFNVLQHFTDDGVHEDDEDDYKYYRFKEFELITE